MNGFVIFLIIVLIVGCIIFVYHLINSYINKKVMYYSKLCQSVFELNEKYKCKTVNKKEHFSIHCKSKKQYDNYCFNSKLIDSCLCDYIKNHYSLIKDYFDKIQICKKNENLYNREFDRLRQTTITDLPAGCKLKINTINNREIKLAEKYRRKFYCSFEIIIKLSYTSPAGRNHYEYSIVRNYSYISRLFHFTDNEINKREYSSYIDSGHQAKIITNNNKSKSNNIIDELESLD